MNQHTNTLEFLGETQKYIHKICHPTLGETIRTPVFMTASKTLVGNSPKTSLSPVRPHDQAMRRMEEEHWPVTRTASSKGFYGVWSTARLRSSQDRRVVKSQTELKLDVLQGAPSTPTTARKTQRLLKSTPLQLQNPKIQAFLNRFETKPRRASKLVYMPRSPTKRTVKSLSHKLTLARLLKPISAQPLTSSLSWRRLEVKSSHLKRRVADEYCDRSESLD
jgi:hypothetical protein